MLSDIAAIAWGVSGVVAFLGAGTGLLHWQRTRRLNLARHLNDRNKRYLLLTNRNTFLHCRRRLGAASGTTAAALLSLETKLGFGSPDTVALALGDYLPAAGTMVKVEVPGSRERLMAIVVTGQNRSLTIRLDPDAGLVRDAKANGKRRSRQVCDSSGRREPYWTTPAVRTGAATMSRLSFAGTTLHGRLSTPRSWGYEIAARLCVSGSAICPARPDARYSAASIDRSRFTSPGGFSHCRRCDGG